MDISRLSPFTYDSATLDPRLIANRDFQVWMHHSTVGYLGKNLSTTPCCTSTFSKITYPI